MKPVIKLIFKAMTQQHPVTNGNLCLPFSAARKSWPLHQTNNMVYTLYTQEAQPWIKTMLKNLIINIFMNTPVFLVGFFAPLVLHNYKNNHSVINSTVSDINETLIL